MKGDPSFAVSAGSALEGVARVGEVAVDLDPAHRRRRGIRIVGVQRAPSREVGSPAVRLWGSVKGIPGRGEVGDLVAVDPLRGPAAGAKRSSQRGNRALRRSRNSGGKRHFSLRCRPLSTEQPSRKSTPGLRVS